MYPAAGPSIATEQARSPISDQTMKVLPMALASLDAYNMLFVVKTYTPNEAKTKLEHHVSYIIEQSSVPYYNVEESSNNSKVTNDNQL